MEQPIAITMLNDFVFCPVSIYFHRLYDGMENVLFQERFQLNGTKAHESLDKGTYSAPHVLQGLEVYSVEYNLQGRIDMYNTKTYTLTERKKHVNTVYDGYVFQLYAQCFAMREMGYRVDVIQIHSLDDNKTYPIALPENNEVMLKKFTALLDEIYEFKPQDYVQTNENKCRMCIYATYCDRGLE